MLKSLNYKAYSDFIESFVNSFSQDVAILSKDVLLHDEMKKSQQFIQNLSLDESLIC